MAEKKKKSPIKLSTDLLVDLGYEKLTQDQAAELLKELYKTLEMVVGVMLSAKMGDDQLDAFSKFIDADDEPGALAWLERNFENYKDEVRESLGRIEGELREVSGISESKKLSQPEALAGSS
jgi:hypothetical protein